VQIIKAGLIPAAGDSSSPVVVEGGDRDVIGARRHGRERHKGIGCAGRVRIKSAAVVIVLDEVAVGIEQLDLRVEA
jgi:hypothetical protein